MQRRDFLKAGPAAGLAVIPASGALAQSGQSNAPGIAAAQRFGVGDITVTTIADGGIQLGIDPLIGIEQEAYNQIMRDNFRDPDSFTSGINAFLIEAGDNVMLVDAGTGGFFGGTANNLMDNLAAAGFAAEDITHLLATHLHPDHVGGAASDSSANFPNAELVVSATERDFWSDESNFSGAGEMMQTFANLATGVLSAYGDRITTFDGEADIASGVTAMPLPGHTPGHSGFMVSSGDQSLLIWADIVHVAPIQLTRPNVAIGFDVNPDQAIQTRRQILDRVTSDRQLVAGSHIGFPGVVNIAAEGDGYRAVDATYDYAAN